MSRYYDANTDEFKALPIIRDVLLVFFGLLLLFGVFGIVGAQERGVKVRMGVIKGVVEPGPYFKLPLLEDVVIMDVKTQTLLAPKDAPLSAASKDLQDTRLAVVVNYTIDPNTVLEVYRQFGTTERYYMTVVEPQIIATVKATASQYTAAEQIQKRSEMTNQTLLSLQAAFDGKGISITKFDLTDISFSPSFTESIDAKVTAVQNAETAKNKLEQVKFEAQQRVEQAKGEAEAIRIQAQAITQQGGEDYVRLKTIEKWNGAGCTSYCGIETSTGLLINR